MLQLPQYKIYYDDGNQRILEAASVKKLLDYLADDSECEKIWKIELIGYLGG